MIFHVLKSATGIFGSQSKQDTHIHTKFLSDGRVVTKNRNDANKMNRTCLTV